MMELYFYEDCEYSQIVLNTIYKLKIQDKFSFKDIRLNPDYAEELEDLTGDISVPCLVNAEGPMKEAKDIRKYLVSHFT
ncbi:MAG: glutathione S-transferase N-terminal domain-containing protein [SAR324 cluster bacterium]|nr:glutathione S-transferase N-terminal domain-containing protein [SAR324 cluster bacterium]MEC9460629.1 glutathione S-transferase N-terminal domain-containing protein [SAR324 cluster bacterium]MED5435000.1 glutathione S-transferase N-terminal domain-containing protein [SAR324 cluster bacterium]